MTKDEIAFIINPDFPGVYAPTTELVRLRFKDGSNKLGFFDYRESSKELEKVNKYTFVEIDNHSQYRETNDDEFITVVDGGDILEVEYPAHLIKDNFTYHNSIELTNEDQVPITAPFDPNLVRIRRDPYTLGELIDRIEHQEINFFTGFQRKQDLWNEKQQSGLIESILLRLPLPAFYFDETEDAKWQVIDGLQRTSAIRNFVILNDLALTGLEFLKQFDKFKYNQLPKDLQRRIKTTPLTVYVVEKGTPDEVKFNIFKRINTGGLVLTAQEIRHALHQGISASFIAELADEEIFREATCWAIKQERMEDRDFVTRFIAFRLINYKKYQPDLDTFLTRGMRELKEISDNQRLKIKTDFRKAMNSAIEIFGIDAFRKRKNKNDRRKPINKALFESLSVNFSLLSQAETDALLRNKETFHNKYLSLNNDPKFENSISSGTGQKESVQLRFKEIERIINETITE